MLPKQYRLQLRKQTDFFRVCRKTHTPFFSLFYTQSDTFKSVVIVSKKVALLATKRNSIKRKYQAAIVKILDILMKFNINLAIVVHSEGISLKIDDIAENIEKNVQKIR